MAQETSTLSLSPFSNVCYVGGSIKKAYLSLCLLCGVEDQVWTVDNLYLSFFALIKRRKGWGKQKRVNVEQVLSYASHSWNPAVMGAPLRPRLLHPRLNDGIWLCVKNTPLGVCGVRGWWTYQMVLTSTSSVSHSQRVWWHQMEWDSKLGKGVAVAAAKRLLTSTAHPCQGESVSLGTWSKSTSSPA